MANSDNSLHLGQAGAELWEHLEPRCPDHATKALALQACRLVDRLDRLDAIARSKPIWIRLADEADDRGHVSVVVDNVLSEFRQQALALTTILAKLGAGKLDEIAAPANSGDKSDELRQRRQEKLDRLSGTENP